MAIEHQIERDFGAMKQESDEGNFLNMPITEYKLQNTVKRMLISV